MTPSNANTSGLEACPFCGGEAWLNDYEAKYSDLPPMSRAPQCRSCGASLGYLTTPAKATEAWNRRVTAASAQAAIDEQEETIESLKRLVDQHYDRATAAEARADRLAQELEWYGEQSRLARLIHREGDAGRNAIAADGGKRARAALQQETQP